MNTQRWLKLRCKKRGNGFLSVCLCFYLKQKHLKSIRNEFKEKYAVSSPCFVDVFMFLLGRQFRVWNFSAFTGTQWFPRHPPPHRCQSPWKPVLWGPAAGQWDAAAPDTGQLRSLSVTRSPRRSCDWYNLSRDTQTTTIATLCGGQNAATNDQDITCRHLFNELCVIV